MRAAITGCCNPHVQRCISAATRSRRCPALLPSVPALLIATAPVDKHTHACESRAALKRRAALLPPRFRPQESIKARHPQLLYESKLYKILQGGGECYAARRLPGIKP